MRNVIGIVMVLVIACGGEGCSRKTAEERGREAANEKTGYAKGVGDALKKDGQNAGEAVGEGVGKVIKGLAVGLDAGVIAVEVRVSESLGTRGIKVTRAHRLESGDGPGKGHGVGAYIIFGEPASASVLVKAFDKSNQEVGRCIAELSGTKDQAGYVDFAFDKQVPLEAVQYYSLELSQWKAAATSPSSLPGS